MYGHCDFIALNVFSIVANFNLELFFNYIMKDWKNSFIQKRIKK
jgi:hypothetical protein